MSANATHTYDAIVVGSGMSGGWAAKELTEKGLKTLVLERGRHVEHIKDYPTADKDPWDLPYGNELTIKDQEEYFIQKKVYNFKQDTKHFFVKDTDHPYNQIKPFNWMRGYQTGGKSLMWSRHCFRWSDLDFEANAKEGIAIDWPLRYRDIAPWYDYVEEFVGVTGQAEGLPQLPDGKFLPAMEMTCAEEVVKDAIAKNFAGDRMMTIGRAAVLTQRHNGRAPCHYCGPCHRGCSTRSYFSSLNATLPAAQKTGKLTLRPHSVVHSLIFDSKARRVSGVRVIDGQSLKALEFHGRVVFLCASTLESTRILLNSATSEFPNGLGNSSGELGHNLMDHIMGGGASATLPWAQDRREIGNRPDAIYVPRFRNVKTKQPDFLRGYGFEGRAWRPDWGRGSEMSGFGAGFKKSLIGDLGPWTMELYGFGEMLPRHENYIELDPHLVDAWGIPALRVNCVYSDNEKKMLDDMVVSATEMFEAMGATDIKPIKDDNPPGLVIHETGTARMGRDPKTSVLNSHNQMWDVQNVFMTDGACMPSTANQNPSITYMALTARAVDYAVAQMKRREL